MTAEQFSLFFYFNNPFRYLFFWLCRRENAEITFLFVVFFFSNEEEHMLKQHALNLKNEIAKKTI